MHKRIIDITGQRFSRLVVISYSHSKGNTYWNCLCNCGNKTVVSKPNLFSGDIKSCGCLLKETYANKRTTEEDKKKKARIRDARYRAGEYGKESVKIRGKKYRESDKGRKKIQETGKAYRQTERHKQLRREYYHSGKGKQIQQANKKKRYNNNLNYRMRVKLKNKIYDILKKFGADKKNTTIELLGCDIEFFLKYMENKFEEGMTWENYGYETWHIDHIIPVSSFDLTKEEEQRKCWHYTNLQPLWAKDNIKKGAKII